MLKISLLEHLIFYCSDPKLGGKKVRAESCMIKKLVGNTSAH